MDTGTVSHFFLSGAFQGPHFAYVSAKRRLISGHMHLTRTLPILRLYVHRQ